MFDRNFLVTLIAFGYFSQSLIIKIVLWILDWFIEAFIERDLNAMHIFVQFSNSVSALVSLSEDASLAVFQNLLNSKVQFKVFMLKMVLDSQIFVSLK